MKKSPRARQKEVAASATKNSGVDLRVVEEMLAFMSQHGLEEFEYEHAGLRVRLKKPGSNPVYLPPRATALPEIVVAGPASSAFAEPGAPAAAREELAEQERAEDVHIVKSPIVGTYYEAPSPGAEPFVRVGDQVASGQILCIIEAMKLMNEIESDLAGEIIRIYVESGQPVEYGESLFAIRPARKK